MGQQISTPDQDEEVRIVREEYDRVVPRDSYLRTIVEPFSQYLSENRKSAAQRKLIRQRRMERFLKVMGVA